MVPSRHLSCVFSLLMLLLIRFETVKGSATLWIRFIRFNNPGGKGDNGHCCDGRLIFCPSKCDHRFVVCLDSRYGRPYDTSSCPFGKKSTGEISDQDSIVFGNYVGGVANPMLFHFDSWPGQVLLKVGVWDRDDNNDDLVDSLKQSISTRPARGRTTARRQRFTIRDRVSLILDVKLYCQPGSYGRTCSVTCEPKNDVTAGYNCERFTGRKICLSGWTGENCDVSEDDCISSRCQHGSTCVDRHQGYTCQCPSGYTGMLCDENIDDCLSQPCQNSGTCLDLVNDFMCICDPKWSGVTCQVRDMCREVTCLNGGTCFNVNGNFTCKCPQGFAGSLCEINVDECLSAPCQNDATCTDLHGAFHCTCSAGWTGVTCETDINECASSPCVHASRCQNLRNDFSCVCDMGYTGQKCDTDIDECLKEPCQNGGNCTNQEPGFQCTCPLGFYGDTCERDVDECETNPCSEGSTCVNVPGGFYCQCKPDFTGPTCDYQIDDCVDQICEHNGTCLDGVHDFQCVCTEHFTGRKCGVYLDRCLATPCRNNATCWDPGYGHVLQCVCPPGWQGHVCDLDVDECLEDPCGNGGRCENSPGGFSCECPEGWTGPLCLEDVNECQLPQPQPCDFPGGGCLPPSSPSFPCTLNATCVNTLGAFRCRCPLGWQGGYCNEDVDECQRGVLPVNVTSCKDDDSDCVIASDSPCAQNSTSCQQESQPACKNNATCLNTKGGYSCACAPGWTGHSCEDDIDECLLSRSMVFSDQEKQTSESFDSPSKINSPDDEKENFFISTSTTSLSWEGEQVTDDDDDHNINISSITITLTSSRPSEEVCLNGGVCQNAAGSFRCLCREGWSGLGCETDVDECGSDPCQNQGLCSNFPGGFTCSCLGPWEGRLCSEEKDECLEEPCRHNGTCIQRKSSRGEGVGGGGVQCVCRRGWRGATCQDDRNECDLDPCLNGGTCVNEVGGFRCLCPEEMAGHRTCGDEKGLDKDVSLPLYLQGRLGVAEESQMSQGIKVFMEQHGDFRHDISIRVFLRTYHMTLGSDQIAVTKVTVNVVVENVTLTETEVADILNRVPLHKLETYLPMPLFMREVEEYLPSGQSRGQEKAMAVPWYVVLLGAAGMAALALLLVYLVRRKLTVRWWWPRRRADATVISPNDSRPPSVDATILENEYVISQPDTTTTLPPDLPPRDPNQSGGNLTRCSLPATRDLGERPRSQASSRSRSGSAAARSEVVWSRPKEVQLRRSSSPGRAAGVGNGRGSSRVVSLARPATEEGESHCFINTVYMTIPDSPPPRAAARVAANAERVEANAAKRVEANAENMVVNANPPPLDPSRRALPLPPTPSEGF